MGRPTTWKTGPTTAIRVPAAFAPSLLKLARMWDNGLTPVKDVRNLVNVLDCTHRRERLFWEDVKRLEAENEHLKKEREQCET